MGRKYIGNKQKGFYTEFRGREELELLNDFRNVCKFNNIPVKSVIATWVECVAYDYLDKKTVGKLKRELGLENVEPDVEIPNKNGRKSTR